MNVNWHPLLLSEAISPSEYTVERIFRWRIASLCSWQPTKIIHRADCTHGLLPYYLCRQIGRRVACIIHKWQRGETAPPLPLTTGFCLPSMHYECHSRIDGLFRWLIKPCLSTCIGAGTSVHVSVYTHVHGRGEGMHINPHCLKSISILLDHKRNIECFRFSNPVIILCYASRHMNYEIK